MSEPRFRDIEDFDGFRLRLMTYTDTPARGVTRTRLSVFDRDQPDARKPAGPHGQLIATSERVDVDPQVSALIDRLNDAAVPGGDWEGKIRSLTFEQLEDACRADRFLHPYPEYSDSTGLHNRLYDEMLARDPDYALTDEQKRMVRSAQRAAAADGTIRISFDNDDGPVDTTCRVDEDGGLVYEHPDLRHLRRRRDLRDDVRSGLIVKLVRPRTPRA